MQSEPVSIGPPIGEPAPNFESAIGPDRVTLHDYRGNWLIVLTHPEDLVGIFRTRTINYLLCKRSVRVICFAGEVNPSGLPKHENFLKRYLRKRRMTMVCDPGGKAARDYGICPGEESGNAKGLFVIDPKGILRIKLYFPIGAERNFYEILKLIDALQKSDRQRTRESGLWRGAIVVRPRVLAPPE